MTMNHYIIPSLIIVACVLVVVGFVVVVVDVVVVGFVVVFDVAEGKASFNFITMSPRQHSEI